MIRHGAWVAVAVLACTNTHSSLVDGSVLESGVDASSDTGVGSDSAEDAGLLDAGLLDATDAAMDVGVDQQVSDAGPALSSWSPAAVLTETQNQRFGECLALNADGSLMVTGRSNGEVLIYRRSGDGSWLREHSQTLGSFIPDYTLGLLDCAMSSDGHTVLVGLQGIHSSGRTPTGGAFIFSHAAGVWSLAAQLSLPEGTVGEERFFGGSVAISRDGLTAYVTSFTQLLAFRANPNWSSWVRTVVTSIDERSANGASTGTGIQLSADGSTLIVPGVEFVLRRNGNTWSRTAALPSARTHYPVTGAAALSPDGTRLLTCFREDGRYLDCRIHDSSGAALNQIASQRVDAARAPREPTDPLYMWDGVLLSDGRWMIGTYASGPGGGQLVSYDPRFGLRSERGGYHAGSGTLAVSADERMVVFGYFAAGTSTGTIDTYFAQ